VLIFPPYSLGANFFREDAPSTRRKAKSLKEYVREVSLAARSCRGQAIDAYHQGEIAAAAMPPGGTD
jgi:hypothetical protein